MNCAECGKKEVREYILEEQQIYLCGICKEKYYYQINVVNGIETVSQYLDRSPLLE